jgi:hypothetical protein
MLITLIEKSFWDKRPGNETIAIEFYLKTMRHFFNWSDNNLEVERNLNQIIYIATARKYYIKDDIHIWMQELKIDYSLDPNVDATTFTAWCINIPNNNKAMLFKLTWC